MKPRVAKTGIYNEPMSEHAIPHKPLSVEEYLALEEASGRKHEYVAGEVYAHAGASRRHNRIVSNVSSSLWVAARGGPCEVYSSDMRLRTADDSFYYPDVMVVCPPPGEPPDDEAMFEDAPCFVVEVTSPSTASIDRREKLAAYKKVPSLKGYVIVAQAERRVERHWRDETGQWWQAEVAGSHGIIPIPCPEVELTLDGVYEGLT